MNKKVFAILVAVIMLVGTISSVAAASKTVADASKKVSTQVQNQFRPSLPKYEKVDKGLLEDAKVRGEKITGKELRGLNGNAYFKPDYAGEVKPLTTPAEQRGIAILVDFPVASDNKSSVPGVDYQQIPSNLFENLLNGNTYNPYDTEPFKWIKVAAEEKGITPATDRTLNNYYKEVSYDKFKINVDVVGWVTLPDSYEHYLAQDKGFYNENGDAFIGELVKDAIAEADKAGVDFKQYAVPAKPGDFADVYGDDTSFTQDGQIVNMIVPNIFIIHRGTGAEYSRDPSIIWSHKWDILSASYYGDYYQTGIIPVDSTLKYEVVDGVAVNTYNICPEVGQDITEFYTKDMGIDKRKPSPVDPGVFAHEFGHVLGLPDQYDYGYESEGTGMFTLMAAGSYGRDVNLDPINPNNLNDPNRLLNRYFSGFSPVHMDAWSKYYLGFANPKLITLNDMKQEITLNPVEVKKANGENPEIYKIVVPDSKGSEYFLLENRQQIGYDKGLAYTVDGKNLHGLVVYHVDENVLMRNFDRPNEAANWDWNNRGKSYKDPSTGENHYGIAVVQADGSWDMEKYINDGDSSDAFPGKKGITKLSADIKSNPNTISYYRWGSDVRGYTGISIDNITEENGIITCNVYLAK